MNRTILEEVRARVALSGEGDEHHYAGLKTDLAQKISCLQGVLVELCDRKQQDYGSANLTDFGPQGVLVRTNDKLQRLKNLMAKRATLDTFRELDGGPLNESVLDTWADLANYGAIGWLMEAGVWPAPPPATGPFIELTETVDGVVSGLRRKLDIMTGQRDEALRKADDWHRQWREISQKAQAVAVPVEPQDRNTSDLSAALNALIDSAEHQ